MKEHHYPNPELHFMMQWGFYRLPEQAEFLYTFFPAIRLNSIREYKSSFVKEHMPDEYKKLIEVTEQAEPCDDLLLTRTCYGFLLGNGYSYKYFIVYTPTLEEEN